MKAYYITINDDLETTEVVFAETPGQAKYKTEAYHDADFTSLRARRVPGLDGKKLTDQNIYLYGKFLVCCRGCESIADTEAGNGPIFDDKGRAWCDRCVPAECLQLETK